MGKPAFRRANRRRILIERLERSTLINRQTNINDDTLSVLIYDAVARLIISR